MKQERKYSNDNEKDIIEIIFHEQHSTLKEVAGELGCSPRWLNARICKCPWYSNEGSIVKLRENIIKLGKQHPNSEFGRFLVRIGVLEREEVKPPVDYSKAFCGGVYVSTNPNNNNNNINQHTASPLPYIAKHDNLMAKGRLI